MPDIAIQVRELALSIAADCETLSNLLDENPDLEVRLPWDWIEEPGDDIFIHLAGNIQDQMGSDW